MPILSKKDTIQEYIFKNVYFNKIILTIDYNKIIGNAVIKVSTFKILSMFSIVHFIKFIRLCRHYLVFVISKKTGFHFLCSK